MLLVLDFGAREENPSVSPLLYNATILSMRQAPHSPQRTEDTEEKKGGKKRRRKKGRREKSLAPGPSKVNC